MIARIRGSSDKRFEICANAKAVESKWRLVGSWRELKSMHRRKEMKAPKRERNNEKFTVQEKQQL